MPKGIINNIYTVLKSVQSKRNLYFIHDNSAFYLGKHQMIHQTVRKEVGKTFKHYLVLEHFCLSHEGRVSFSVLVV